MVTDQTGVLKDRDQPEVTSPERGDDFVTVG